MPHRLSEARPYQGFIQLIYLRSTGVYHDPSSKEDGNPDENPDKGLHCAES